MKLILLQGFALCADMIYIQQSACRLWRALYEIALKKEWSALSLRILEICIMTERRIWRSQSALRQFTAIPEIIIRKIEKVNAFSWEKYGELSAQDLGELVKLPKMGKTLHKFVHMVPKVKVSANVYPLSRALLRFEVSAVLDFEFNEQVHGGQMLFWLTVEDADREKILYLEPFLVRAYTTEYLLDFNVSMLSPLPPHYFLTITSDRWLHSTSTTPVSFKNLFLPPRFPPPSELLDLQPLPVSAFNEPLVESFFHPLQTLNPIQTQTHNALFGDSQNVLVCAPHGSGKTLCGELAILRVLLHGSVGKVVCIQSNQDQASILLDNWTEKFSKIGYSVCMLEGDQLRDLEAIKRSRVVISSPGFWESVSRKWRQRKVFRSFELFLFDDIHTIAGERGAVYETVICRTRFMITQLQNNARIVGLSYCIANARDMGDVLGVRSDAVFNFSPTSRPTPLDVRIVPLDEVDVSGRLQAMMKPISRLIAAMDKRSNIIVFCPSRKHGHMLAVDLVALMAKKGSSDASMNNLVYPNQDEAIAQTLKFGVCCLHECLSSSEISLLFGLFNERKLQCMIVPFSLAYKVSLVADQVVIADAVSFDGIHNRFFDLRAMDLWQMIGRAGRRESQSPGRVQIFCHSSRKERLRMLIHDLVPIESQLDHNLHDLFNAEIAAQTITSKADAVDLLTWTFYYRRLAQNPNFYGLRAAGHQQLSDHLSELVETVINDLEECKCISVENDMDVSPLNYGMIAAFYGVSYATIELFSSSISEKTKFRAMSEILCASKEVGLPIRPAEDVSISTLASSFNVELDFDRDSAVEIMKKKAYILLQSHFNRVAISTELRADQLSVLKHSVLLVQAMVDVISSQGWLKPALVAMEVSQCVVQGMRLSDPVLGQVPHLSSNLIEELGALEPPVETVYDLLDMEDAQREHYLRFSQQQLSEIAEFCNSYPSMQVTYDTSFTSGVEAGAAVSIQVTCSREIPDDAPFEANVVSSRYPYGKKEAWWIVVGDPKTNVLFSIKRFIACGEFKVSGFCSVYQ